MSRFKLSDNRYEEIKKFAANTLNDIGLVHFPISGFEFASKLGLKCIPYGHYNEQTQKLCLAESEDSFLVPYKNTIFYNEKMPYKRQNYTLTHECGHFVLDHSEDSELAEAEANFFAKFVLAPPVIVNYMGIEDPVQLAEAFNVSISFACYALEYYNKWLLYGEKSYTPYEELILTNHKNSLKGGDRM